MVNSEFHPAPQYRCGNVASTHRPRQDFVNKPFQKFNSRPVPRTNDAHSRNNCAFHVVCAGVCRGEPAVLHRRWTCPTAPRGERDIRTFCGFGVRGRSENRISSPYCQRAQVVSALAMQRRRAEPSAARR